MERESSTKFAVVDCTPDEAIQHVCDKYGFKVGGLHPYGQIKGITAYVDIERSLRLDRRFNIVRIHPDMAWPSLR